jgi:septal ring factor EnvC (AmiA/AmiB activator)
VQYISLIKYLGTMYIVFCCAFQEVHKHEQIKLQSALLEETNKRKASEQRAAQLDQQLIAANAEIDLLTTRLHDSDTKLQQAMQRYVSDILLYRYVCCMRIH